MRNIIEKIKNNGAVTNEEIKALLLSEREDAKYLFDAASKVRQAVFGNSIYIRGLIEISSFCKNDCLYCGLRRSNKNAQRYRLTKEDIISRAELGHSLGFRTFVLQGGEDAYFTDEVMCDVVSSLKEKFPDSAVTLSIGERSFESYKKLKEAGADRYLLRHESSNADHYARLHSPEQKLDTRLKCLTDLKSLGYQVGCGFMVGSPYQTLDDVVNDIRFCVSFGAHMVGVGPFIHHSDTPFKDFPNGSVELTLRCLAVLRLMMPKVLLPATTALGSISCDGRERGIMAGANVLMPNLSPIDVREKYSLYNGKLSTGIESAEGLSSLAEKLSGIGCEISVSRGDHGNFIN